MENHELRTFATYLQSGGYRTAYFSKFVNSYLTEKVPEQIPGPLYSTRLGRVARAGQEQQVLQLQPQQQWRD